MPRRRPGALRAGHPGRPRRWDKPPPGRIHGLSARTSNAIHRVEELAPSYLYPGAVDRALRRYEAFLAPPGRRPLYPQDPDCGCVGHSLDDVRHARDLLEEALAHLLPRARAELGRRIASLDRVYLKRTLPDPLADRRPWKGDVWWYRRLYRVREG
ncbi:hypothetical protein [Streptomyces sp. NPDC127103]|uniref:hypothetical protein n=1 Tax=Streptomyces sp. NPDC127103 TaxID=3347139 RepID=UPI003669B51F